RGRQSCRRQAYARAASIDAALGMCCAARLGGAGLGLCGTGTRPASGALDGPEAVGAVDRLVHAGLERHLGRVAALGADHREVLPGWAVIAPLVTARTTDVAHVVAGCLAHVAA